MYMQYILYTTDTLLLFFNKIFNCSCAVVASIITPIDPRQYLIKDQPGAVVVDIRGYPPPDYVWKKDGTDLNITGRYSIASNGTLLISMVQTGDNGTYILTASKSIFHANSGDIVVTLRGDYDYLIL